jgi:GTPase SAR1 family protein
VVGAYADGKTSLVKRFVEGIFTDKYLATVDVKVDKIILKLISTNFD